MSLASIQFKTKSIFEEYGITYAAVFGSVSRGEENKNSDVDILVHLGKPMGMFTYMQMIHKLENSLGKKVDIVTDKSLNKYIKPYITPDLKVIYER